ncbi:PilZ domain-containing protein [Agaribacterium haliotis]|uniref:PilZ domain-containing protein n=1 Tax=Agaribacterium haliotis TaxID=2013869 RepID=UPI000BB58F0F|nr:PilZ domain-containing protein [Agaribacterium haliotis]
MSSELRKSERHELHKPLLVKNCISAEVLGTLVNLSSEGLMLLGPAEVNEGGVYQVEIAFSDGVSVLTMGLECLWVNPGAEESQVWSGYKIIDISDDAQALLEQCIAQLG